MGKGLFENQVKKCNTNLLILNILLSIFLLLIFSFFLKKIDLTLIIFILLLLIPIYFFYKLYERFFDYRNHPLYTKFLRFDNPQKIENLIENELKNKVILSQNGFTLTEHWIIQESWFDFFVISYTEILWVYIKETKHSVNFIPTGTTYSIQIRYRLINTHNPHDTIMEIDFQSSKEEASNCFLIIQNNAPWAFFGFDPEIKNQWDTNPNSMVNAVHSRMNELFKVR